MSLLHISASSTIVWKTLNSCISNNNNVIIIIIMLPLTSENLEIFIFIFIFNNKIILITYFEFISIK